MLKMISDYKTLQKGQEIEVIDFLSGDFLEVRLLPSGEIAEIPAGCAGVIRAESAAVALGSIKSEKKAKSSAENGRLGGRPRK